jgi:hypothetical protein
MTEVSNDTAKRIVGKEAVVPAGAVAIKAALLAENTIFSADTVRPILTVSDPQSG